MSGTYVKQIGTNYPGLFLALIDQSSSMSGAKATAAAKAVNDVITEIIAKCTDAEEGLKDRVYVGVIGYGAGGATGLVGGSVVKLAEQTHWVNPTADGGTPMAEAFQLASQLVTGWLGDGHPNRMECFPPIVVNISDGEPNDAAAARSQADALKALGTNDGTTLVFNVHISGASRPQEVVFPTAESEMPDELGRLMFQLSSPLPDTLLKAAALHELPSRPGSRALAYGASTATLVKVLNFGSSQI